MLFDTKLHASCWLKLVTLTCFLSWIYLWIGRHRHLDLTISHHQVNIKYVIKLALRVTDRLKEASQSFWWFLFLLLLWVRPILSWLLIHYLLLLFISLEVIKAYLGPLFIIFFFLSLDSLILINLLLKSWVSVAKYRPKFVWNFIVVKRGDLMYHIMALVVGHGLCCVALAVYLLIYKL